MTADEIAKVVTDAGFTKVTLATFFKDATKPIQVAAIREKIAGVQKDLAAKQAEASQTINALNAEIEAMG